MAGEKEARALEIRNGFCARLSAYFAREEAMPGGTKNEVKEKGCCTIRKSRRLSRLIRRRKVGGEPFKEGGRIRELKERTKKEETRNACSKRFWPNGEEPSNNDKSKTGATGGKPEGISRPRCLNSYISPIAKRRGERISPNRETSKLAWIGGGGEGSSRPLAQEVAHFLNPRNTAEKKKKRGSFHEVGGESCYTSLGQQKKIVLARTTEKNFWGGAER